MSDADLTSHNVTMRDDTSSSRFELHVDGERVSHADYRIDGDVVTIRHVETDRAHRGNGYAEQLMASVIVSIRSNGQEIRPVCPFAVAYVRKHPDTHDLAAR